MLKANSYALFKANTKVVAEVGATFGRAASFVVCKYSFYFFPEDSPKGGEKGRSERDLWQPMIGRAAEGEWAREEYVSVMLVSYRETKLSFHSCSC